MIPNNEDRALWAKVGLDAFTEQVGGRDNDLETQISDFIADLMHLSNLRRLDWDTVLERAERHYREELAEQEEERRYVAELSLEEQREYRAEETRARRSLRIPRATIRRQDWTPGHGERRGRE